MLMKSAECVLLVQIKRFFMIALKYYSTLLLLKKKALRDKRKEILLTGFPGGPLSPGFPALPFKKKNIHMND